MNQAPDVELVLRSYLADTGDRAPDRVLEDVAARIARQPRRRTGRLSRRPYMNTYAKLGSLSLRSFAVPAGRIFRARPNAGPRRRPYNSLSMPAVPAGGAAAAGAGGMAPGFAASAGPGGGYGGGYGAEPGYDGGGYGGGRDQGYCRRWPGRR